MGTMPTQPTAAGWDDATLDALRSEGDPLADRVIDTIFAQDKPSAVLVNDLPYPKGFDGTDALKN